VGLGEVSDYIKLLRRMSVLAADPERPPVLRSADPDDDYLIALATAKTPLSFPVTDTSSTLPVKDQSSRQRIFWPLWNASKALIL